MTYTICPDTKLNTETNQFETGVSIDGEIISFYCSEQPEESKRRAVVAAMLMAIEEAEYNFNHQNLS